MIADAAALIAECQQLAGQAERVDVAQQLAVTQAPCRCCRRLTLRAPGRAMTIDLNPAHCRVLAGLLVRRSGGQPASVSRN